MDAFPVRVHARLPLRKRLSRRRRALAATHGAHRTTAGPGDGCERRGAPLTAAVFDSRTKRKQTALAGIASSALVYYSLSNGIDACRLLSLSLSLSLAVGVFLLFYCLAFLLFFTSHIWARVPTKQQQQQQPRDDSSAHSNARVGATRRAPLKRLAGGTLTGF